MLNTRIAVRQKIGSDYFKIQIGLNYYCQRVVNQNVRAPCDVHQRQGKDFELRIEFENNHCRLEKEPEANRIFHGSECAVLVIPSASGRSIHCLSYQEKILKIFDLLFCVEGIVWIYRIHIYFVWSDQPRN